MGGPSGTKHLKFDHDGFVIEDSTMAQKMQMKIQNNENLAEQLKIPSKSVTRMLDIIDWNPFHLLMAKNDVTKKYSQIIDLGLLNLLE